MKLSLLLIASSLVLVGCSEPLSDHEKEIRRIEKQTKTLQKEAQTLGVYQNESEEQLIDFTILKDDASQPVASQPMKRSVDVQITTRLSRGDLERLGHIIRGQSEHKDRLFINYYLPGQTVGAGAWASTHFTPGLNLKIHGMTEKQANDPYPVVPEGATLMAKFNGNEFLGEKAVIFKEADGSFKQISKYKDGSKKTTQLYSQDGKRFETRNDFGEYLVLSSSSVKVYDPDGLIDSYSR